MRLIDVDSLQNALMDEYVGIAGYNTRTQFYRAIEIVQQQPAIIPPSNDPLTLEELREIDIAYCVPPNEWAKPTEFGLQFFGQSICLKWGEISHKYGKTWSAYRRKPEEVEE